MSFTWKSTNYTEFISDRGGASPILSLANDASWATRMFDVAWGAQIQAVDDFVGYALVASTGLSYPNPTAYVSRSIPMPFPHYTEQAVPPAGSLPRYAMYCTKINKIQGIGFGGYSVDNATPGGLPLAYYRTARMELGYESLPYDVLTDQQPDVLGAGGLPDEATLARYVTKTSNSNADYLTLNQGILIYAEGPNQSSAVPFGPGKIVVNHDFRYRWELVPKEAVPSLVVDPTLTVGPVPQGNAAIEFTLGRVNDNWFPGRVPGRGYQPGTLLLTAALITPIRGVTGRRLFSVEYFMKWFGPGHHKIFGPSATGVGSFVEISTDGSKYPIVPTTQDGKHIYDVASFDWLFRPPYSTTATLTTQQPPQPMTATLSSVPQPP